jgi:hypothetical protein
MVWRWRSRPDSAETPLVERRSVVVEVRSIVLLLVTVSFGARCGPGATSGQRYRKRFQPDMPTLRIQRVDVTADPLN